MKNNIFIIVSFVVVLAFSSGVSAAHDLTVLFTHDMHSHLEKDSTNLNGVTKESGGFARLKTAIDERKALHPNSVLVDAGDFSMGTLFQTIYTKEASELRMMGKLGYDFATLGNHEFNCHAQGLTSMLYAAVDSGDILPQLLIANIDWKKTLADEKLVKNASDLDIALEAVKAKPYEITEVNGIPIAVFGILGKKAGGYTPLSGLYFSDPIKTAKSVVSEIKKESPNAVIIALSHSGTKKDQKSSEDQQLAMAVPDIDVIISGHSHTTLKKPIVHGNTLVVSAGEYTKNLGSLTISLDGKNTVIDYSMIPINENLTENSEIKSSVDEYKNKVESSYLAEYGYKFDEVVAKSSFNFTPLGKFAKEHKEDIFGNLISDSYIYATSLAAGENHENLDIALVSSRAVRSSFSEGDITASQIFNVSSFGVGPDEETGYPLVGIYLKGRELKAICEVNAPVSSIMPQTQLYISGLNFTYNPNRLLLNRVTEVNLTNAQGKSLQIEEDKLYGVVTDLYSAQMLGSVNNSSMKLLSLNPKDKEGNEIKNFEDFIIRGAQGNEIKAWHGLAQYMGSFPKKQGVPIVPAAYSQAQGRVVVDDDNSLIAKLENPNRAAWSLVVAVLGAIFAVYLLIAVPVKLYLGYKKKIAAG